MNQTDWNYEVKDGKRFEFGKNWKSFLKTLTDDRIEIATKSLQDMLNLDNLRGKTFLDFGCGSGLFSLAAYKLGATVRSIDFDPQSVACTEFLREKYKDPNSTNWEIQQGSVLDQELIAGLGKFDIVYSWGVLHHTGEMWSALENIGKLSEDGGLLFISIYNDQGKRSKRWLLVKKIFNNVPFIAQQFLLGLFIIRFTAIGTIKEIILLRPFKEWREYKKSRGMSRVQNIRDWIGGLPFEVARPESIFIFFKKRNFELLNLITCGGGLGCNEFVFKKQEASK